MTTRISDDGRYYWDGTQWQPAISADGQWRWDGTRWIPRNKSAALLQGRTFRVGSWIGAALSGVLGVICLIGVTAELAAWSQGSREAPSGVAGGLILLSVATLLAAPLVIRLAIRRGIVLAASLATGLLFLGSCGGSIALSAAFPPPSPSASVALASPNSSRSPKIPDTGSASTSPTTVSSPSATPSPTPHPTPTPPPSPSPVVSTPSPSPQPASPPPPPPSPVASTCGAPSNPWGYNFCGRGGYITDPPADFCTYFAPCVSTFWTAISGYVVQCASGSWSHSGGVSGACSHNGGVARVLYSGP